MADFGANATQLSEAQGRGTSPLAPVQEQVSKLGIMPVFEGVADILAKGLKNDAKEKAEARKKAVLDEYNAAEKSYVDALTSGGINAAQHGARSRANFAKFMAQYGGEYGEDLNKARGAWYGGSEAGEAQKQVDAEKKQFDTDLANASSRGFTFYPGMSEAAKLASINASKTAIRIETEFDNQEKRLAAERAANAEGRADYNFKQQVSDYVRKDQAVEGLRAVAAANLDDFVARAGDLQAQVNSGKMTYEAAMIEHGSTMARIRAGAAAVSDKFPELAGPWTKIFDDLDNTYRQLLDPKSKSANELQLLKDRYEKLIVTGKLAAVERDPKMLNAVVGTELFRNDPYITMTASAPIRQWIDANVNGTEAKPIVGKPEDKQLFNTVEKMINNVDKVPADAKEKYTQELTKSVNGLLKETAGVDGSLDPKALMTASKFFSSSAFGKMVLEGKLDAQTAANAQHVFQVQYVPKVREALIDKLKQPFNDREQEGYFGAKSLLDVVQPKLVGGKVVFEAAPVKSDGRWGIFSKDSIQAQIGTDRAKEMNVAAEAVNQLVRLHAHLEGTTDYAKYWEANKHTILPGVFPDPAKLKPGQSVDGYKYLGGNVRDRNNWIAEPKPAAGK